MSVQSETLRLIASFIRSQTRRPSEEEVEQAFLDLVSHYYDGLDDGDA